MSDRFESFLGRGWKFPIQVDAQTGKVLTSEYEADIVEAIKIIIMTRKGERVMRPDFGCDILDHLFDVVDYTLLKQMENTVKNALISWEPRITEVEVEAIVDAKTAEKIDLHIAYVVRTTNNPFNLVYPFYINEGNI
ncbi:GPW/gp25 family protein [Fusibacter sp. 3D3]|uniref:GPW/gp25 family protein n=1 Tax=Fusibacter sp. 3D3 TaxID=1048380 RepID=UPI000852F2C3|nr:GPW/gp25 family protein [Fusibacter sp. 3D3]GAU77511.1 GPW/gp25 family protein [Fusibacter sp. 3D3]